jgi:mono/diheme cytochrome c family protein
MKAFIARLALLLAIPVVAAIGLIYWLKSTGLSARPAPSAMEISAARKAARMAIPEKERLMSNPMSATPELIAEGRRHFADHCATCHGNDGSGQTEIGRNLYPRAPDMRQPSTQKLTDGELYYIIENGVRDTGMPAWGTGGDDDHETWHLVLFIRALPNLKAEDVDDMKNFNPRSPAEMKEEQEEDQFLSQPAAPSRPSKPR